MTTPFPACRVRVGAPCGESGPASARHTRSVGGPSGTNKTRGCRRRGARGHAGQRQGTFPSGVRTVISRWCRGVSWAPRPRGRKSSSLVSLTWGWSAQASIDRHIERVQKTSSCSATFTNSLKSGPQHHGRGQGSTRSGGNEPGVRPTCARHLNDASVCCTVTCVRPCSSGSLCSGGKMDHPSVSFSIVHPECVLAGRPRQDCGGATQGTVKAYTERPAVRPRAGLQRLV